MKRLMILAILAMQVASVCAQQNDFYFAGVRSDTLAAVYKNNELLYTNFEEGNRWCWADCMVISNNGDVYYGGAGNSFGYVWKSISFHHQPCRMSQACFIGNLQQINAF